MEITHKINVKNYGLLVLASLIPVIITFIFMKFISLNLSYALIVSIIALISVALWHTNSPLHIVSKLLVLTFPLSVVYYLLILPEIPGLWIAIPIFIVIVLSVFAVKNKILSSTVSIVIALLVSFLYVPDIVAKNLTQTVVEEAPKFSIRSILDDSEITNRSLKGKVVVLDFFGTWCAPCIKEMKELKEIEDHLNKENVEFIIACIETSGDTPEKAQNFYDNRKLPFTLAFDYSSTTHKAFKFSGVPALAILDKEGNIRLKHEGYNEAEDLKSTLIPILKQLSNE